MGQVVRVARAQVGVPSAVLQRPPAVPGKVEQDGRSGIGRFGQDLNAARIWTVVASGPVMTCTLSRAYPQRSGSLRMVAMA